jgi:hypothetical protein
MQNIKELRETLISNYEELKDGKIERALVGELNNTVGKIISTVTTELKYQNQHGLKRKIDFLEYEE